MKDIIKKVIVKKTKPKAKLVSNQSLQENPAICFFGFKPEIKPVIQPVCPQCSL